MNKVYLESTTDNDDSCDKEIQRRISVHKNANLTSNILILKPINNSQIIIIIFSKYMLQKVKCNKTSINTDTIGRERGTQRRGRLNVYAIVRRTECSDFRFRQSGKLTNAHLDDANTPVTRRCFSNCKTCQCRHRTKKCLGPRPLPVVYREPYLFVRWELWGARQRKQENRTVISETPQA